MAELGTVERAYADGYAAAQHEIARLRAALDPLAAIVRKWNKDHLGGHIGDDDEVYVPCKLLFAADSALANEQLKT